MDSEIFSDDFNCGRCGRELTDEISIDRGYGPVCYQKHLKALADEEFKKNQVTIDEVIEGDAECNDTELLINRNIWVKS